MIPAKRTRGPAIHTGAKPRKLPKLSMGWCDFFVCDSLACIPHLAISGSGPNAIGLSLIQLLESCQRVLRLLYISAPPIGLREVCVNRFGAGFALPRPLHIRDRIGHASVHQVNAAKSQLRSWIIRPLHDSLLQSSLRFREFRLTCTATRTNQVFPKNRQQCWIFVPALYTFARGSDCRRNVPLEEFSVRSSEIADLARRRKFADQFKLWFGLIKLIELSEKHGSFVMQSRRSRQVSQSDVYDFEA